MIYEECDLDNYNCTGNTGRKTGKRGKLLDWLEIWRWRNKN